MCLEKALEFSLRKPELTKKFIHSCGSMEYFEIHTNNFCCTKCSGRVIEQCLFYVCRSLNKREIEQADMLDIGQSNSMAPNYTTSYVYIYIGNFLLRLPITSTAYLEKTGTSHLFWKNSRRWAVEIIRTHLDTSSQIPSLSSCSQTQKPWEGMIAERKFWDKERQ